jgi:hypothetical protein
MVLYMKQIMNLLLCRGGVSLIVDSIDQQSEVRPQEKCGQYCSLRIEARKRHSQRCMIVIAWHSNLVHWILEQVLSTTANS